MEIITKSAKETTEAGRRLSADFTGGEVLIFKGDLGAGKTTFIQGLAEGLNVKGRINSPTFIIMREYEMGSGRNFYHIDLYRLEENIKQELENLGILDLMQENKHVFAIEWGEKAREFLPKNAININFNNIGEEQRKIEIIKN